VRLVLGLPSTGGSLPQFNWQEKVVAAVSLRQQLGVNDPKDLDVQLCINRVKRGGLDALTMRCFYLAIFNRLLFPTASWEITNREKKFTDDMEKFDQIDWCHLIYVDLCHAVMKWHKRNRD
jgi:hypothetical protein